MKTSNSGKKTCGAAAPRPELLVNLLYAGVTCAHVRCEQNAGQKLAEITPPPPIITSIKCYLSWYNCISCLRNARKTIVGLDL